MRWTQLRAIYGSDASLRNWYLAFPLGLGHLEMKAGRGIAIDRLAMHCCTLKLLPALQSRK